MAKKAPNNSPEKNVVTVEDVLKRAKKLSKYSELQKCNKPAARKRLFEEIVRGASTSLKGFLSSSEDAQNAFLESAIHTAVTAPDEHLPKPRKKKTDPSKVVQDTHTKVGDVVPASSLDVQSSDLNPVEDDIEWLSDPVYVATVVNQSADGITFGDVQVNNQVPDVVYVDEVKTRSGDARNTVPENDGLTALQGLNLDGTDFRSLNHEQQVAFANMIAFARRKGWTTETLNKDRAKLMDAIAKAKEVTAPSRSGSSSEWTNRHTAIAAAATVIFGIPLAVGVLSGGAYLLSDKDKPTPAVAPAQGVTTADMPSPVSGEKVHLGGGFMQLDRQNDGTLVIESKNKFAPIKVTFRNSQGESVVRKDQILSSGNIYRFGTDRFQGSFELNIEYQTPWGEIKETGFVEVR